MSISLREGRKRLIDAFDEISNKKRRQSTLSDGPLRGVVACLSGLPTETKTRLHQVIEDLGGSYTREFNLDKNTHLIAEAAQGAKFDLAISCPRIHIVTPLWLSTCSQSRKRVNEAAYLLSKANRCKPASVTSQLEELLAGPTELRPIFEFHRFYLLGFDGDIEMKRKLGKLIRRGYGTIYWEMNEQISMTIMHESCDTSLRKAAHTLTIHHPMKPPTVSPLWVLESWKHNKTLRPSKFPPMKLRSSSSKKDALPTKSSLSRTHSSLTRKKSASALFRGCLFALVRIAPPTWALDFDTEEEEAWIKSHGGQILSLKLMDAMRTDAKNGAQRRKCHVVCWGGRPRLELNPIVSQLKRHDLCDLVLVTPMWLKTCVTVQKRVRPDRFPLALAPQQWPLRKLESGLCISLTGFQGTEKSALVHLIEVIGGSFKDTMNSNNTHLICKEKATGLKLEKAIEWGLHIVSIEWLEHILEYGYGGKEQSKGGCESRFSLRDA